MHSIDHDANTIAAFRAPEEREQKVRDYIKEKFNGSAAQVEEALHMPSMDFMFGKMAPMDAAKTSDPCCDMVIEHVNSKYGAMMKPVAP